MGYSQDSKEDILRRKEFQRKSDELGKLINAVPFSNYGVDVQFRDIEWMIERYANSYDGFDENPDFQRGHVWTLDQQIKYIEAIVRGTVGASGRLITLSCPDFQRDQEKDSDLKGFVVVDGLQRLTAIRKFCKGEFRIFNDIIDGGADLDYFNGTRYNLNSMSGVRFQVFSFQYKKEILDYYLAFNDGGTVHTQEEIDRVSAMRKALD